MIEIFCPNNNAPEREYIISILLSFVGVPFNITFTDDVDCYIVQTKYGRIHFEDHFFNLYPIALSYFKKENVPYQVKNYTKIENICVPIIFGRNHFEKVESDFFCGLDIFASSFFMLTRWEEFLLGREERGLCKEELLLAVRSNITNRPIVNEYCDILRKILIEQGVSIKNERNFSVFLTHDVDRCYLSSIKELVYNLNKMIQIKKYKKANHIFWIYIYYKIFNKKPFNSFDELMDISEKYGFINHFYFKTCEKNESGYTYCITDDFVKKTMDNIIKRGHKIGFHPSENTFNNNMQFQDEYNRLRVYTANIESGRNHGLFCNVKTLYQWNDSKIPIMSNFGFQFRYGFRCGVCYPFQLFNIYKREKMNIQEIPFLLMDTVAMRRNVSAEILWSEITVILNEVIKHNGILCVNWHTNVINMREMSHYKNIYVKLLNYIANNAC